MARTFGINRIAQDLYRKDNVFLVCTFPQLIFFARLIKEHYGEDIVIRVHKTGTLFTVFHAAPLPSGTQDELLSIRFRPLPAEQITDAAKIPVFSDVTTPEYTLYTTSKDWQIISQRLPEWFVPEEITRRLVPVDS